MDDLNELEPSDMPDAAAMNDPMQPDFFGANPDAAKPPQTAAQDALVARIMRTIKADKKHHEKAFKQMRRDMHLAKYGAPPEWPKDNYVANIIGRFVRMKTAALYAKNPKATARRRDTLDFQMWDENPDTLKLAFSTIQNAGIAANTPPEQAQPELGQPGPSATQLPQGFEQAQQLLADFQQGQARRDQLDKIGKTLEILFAHAVQEQKPVDFKVGAKRMVRRACTTAVGYVELGFQREMGPRPGLTEQLTDARTRLDHLQNLAAQVADGDITQDDAEMAELEASIASLEAEPEIVLREGLIFDFPESTKVIPDRLCKSVVGFIGARHLTIEYIFTPDEVTETFGVDLRGQYKGYSTDAKDDEFDGPDPNKTDDSQSFGPGESARGAGLVRVWKHYDKPSGLVYYVAEGYDAFLREPAAPDVFVDDFWPVYALTFNDVEHEDELFPPSDAALLLPMQLEYNRARQGQREHREAARPRWVHGKGLLEAEDINTLKTMKPFEVAGINIPQGQKIQDILMVVPVPGVDPNLYETSQLFTDTQLVVGAQEAQFGGTSASTATESAIAANSSASSDGSSIDDLDNFLTTLARASGQILLREMSQDQVMRVVGPGAVWPQVPLADIADDIFLEVEAGSTGKPNQAVEVHNMQILAPLLMQIPEVNPRWLGTQIITRLDDKANLTDAFVANIPSMIAQNQQTQMAPPGEADPNQQGPQGAANAPLPPKQPGSTAHFGSNQV